MMFSNKMCLFVVISLALVLSSNALNSPQDFLDAHNEARAQVGVGPMTWDNAAATYAQNYANSRNGDCTLIHSQGPYGENLAIGGNARDAVNMWVGEKSSFKNEPITEKNYSHYSQVVWRNSTGLGCARTPCSTGDAWFVICNYNPPGNYIGERPY